MDSLFAEYSQAVSVLQSLARMVLWWGLCPGTEAGRSKAELLKLLRPGGALAEAKAVVVYTTFQLQAEDVARHLHSHGITAAAYHAGKHLKVTFKPLGQTLVAGVPTHIWVRFILPQHMGSRAMQMYTALKAQMLRPYEL